MLRAVDIDAVVWEQLLPKARKFMPYIGRMVDACEQGRAQCFECNDGYVVTTIDINPVSHKPELRVWWASVNRRVIGCFERYLPFMRFMARALNCVAIVFGTVRTGWSRKALKLGFVLRGWVPETKSWEYALELT